MSHHLDDAYGHELINVFLDPANGYVQRLSAAARAHGVAHTTAMAVLMVRLVCTNAWRNNRQSTATVAHLVGASPHTVRLADRAAEAAGLITPLTHRLRGAAVLLMLPELDADEAGDAS